MVTSGAGISQADPYYPGPTNCGAPGAPACLPVGVPAPTECAIVAALTWRPCNWEGVPVAPGTPGSW
ncbi:hypothetical protein KIH27_21630 [Mycobacterium sp. M1]|uniref:Uncharacterized protein n=1 Tax=Mycolicibacter acidiphilus TaxID=2835306 RepID=A0ABS5RQ87_9MYCO|nr:hypothetical protein [Mycolicibacter acidiphilus]MBS9536187.1 hypothetical protein [Mycolicibacter acidiphilus]